MTRPLLSIVIPVRDDEARLAGALQAIRDYLRRESLHAELLVVDDGSRDATARLAEAALRGGAGRLLRHDEPRGRGYALRRGLAAAQGRWALTAPVGCPTPIAEHAKLAAAARDRDLDLVLGSRMPPPAAAGQAATTVPPLERLFGRVVRAATGLRLRDCFSSFRLLDRVHLRPLIERATIDGPAFDVELTFLCARFGLRMDEVAVSGGLLAKGRLGLPAGWSTLPLDLLRMRRLYRRGAYHPARARGAGLEADGS